MKAEPQTKKTIVVRQLTASDLGWFAGARQRGAAAGRQRAIQVNARVVRELLTDEEYADGGTDALTRRASSGSFEERPLRKNEKNWRLMGPKVEDADLHDVSEGDLFVMVLWRSGSPLRLRIVWDVITKSRDRSRHRDLQTLVSASLSDNMAVISPELRAGLGVGSILEWVRALCGRASPAAEQPKPPLPSQTAAPAVREPAAPQHSTTKPQRTNIAVRAGKERKSVREHLRQPHILVEMMKHGMSLSARAQQDYLERIEALATTCRDLLVDAGMIRKILLSQRDAWDAVRRQRFSFVDGGVANIQALGSEPLAIRVGSYSVTPGVPEAERDEQFEHVRVLVDELYEVGAGEGLYDDFFEDPAKLRDAARWCLEMAAVLDLLLRKVPPEIVYLHGPLVSPVSPYALDGFPNFARSRLPALLPGDTSERTGRDANFLCVYLEQLRRVRERNVPIVGVVERASTTRLASLYTFKALEAGGYMAGQERASIESALKLYRITDPVLFECVLEEGEYLAPLPMDKNRTPDGHDKIPNHWRDVIESYPAPLVTYAKPSSNSLPIRVEMFVPTASEDLAERLIDTTIHMSRLLPRYAFPAGLDIVDKFAKVPAWMSLQLSKALAAQVLRKALDTKNPQVISMARRFLSGNAREWLFRPKA